MKKYFSNVHKIRGAHLQCMDNHLAKFEYKGMKTVGSYRLHKLGTPKVLLTDERTDRRTKGPSGPTTRPAFAKVTQVKRYSAALQL